MKKFYLASFLVFVVLFGAVSAKNGDNARLDSWRTTWAFFEGAGTTLRGVVTSGGQADWSMDPLTAPYGVRSGDESVFAVSLPNDNGEFQLNPLNRGVAELFFTYKGQPMASQNSVTITVFGDEPDFKTLNSETMIFPNDRFIRYGEDFIVTLKSAFPLFRKGDKVKLEGVMTTPSSDVTPFTWEASFVSEKEMEAVNFYIDPSVPAGRYQFEVSMEDFFGFASNSRFDVYVEEFEDDEDFADPFLSSASIHNWSPEGMTIFGRIPQETQSEILLWVSGNDVQRTFVSYWGTPRINLKALSVPAGMHDVAVFFPSTGEMLACRKCLYMRTGYPTVYDMTDMPTPPPPPAN